MHEDVAALVRHCTTLWSGDHAPLHAALLEQSARLRDWRDVESVLENATGFRVDGECMLADDVIAALRSGPAALDALQPGVGTALGDPAFAFDVLLHREAWEVDDWRADLARQLGSDVRVLALYRSLLAPVYAIEAFGVGAGGIQRDTALRLDAAERQALDLATAVLEARGFRRLANADLATPVPGAWTDLCKPGEATLFQCLFTDARPTPRYPT